jgi:hypothetical protein
MKKNSIFKKDCLTKVKGTKAEISDQELVANFEALQRDEGTD